jgi:N,N'-diacetyllegionaminate synthase
VDFNSIIEKAEKDLFIIAEAGVNHNGDLDIAKELVDVAAKSGCDAVKFQTWKTEKVYCQELSIKPEYQKQATDREESEFDTIKKLELSFDAFRELKEYCDSKEILFLSTPDEQESADFLVDDLRVPIMKTASQDVTNTPFLKYLGQKEIPLIFSTGAATLTEVIEGVETILNENEQLILLHCVSSYPAPLEDLNLNVIPRLAAITNCPVGFSDHTVGVEASCVALALGARFFEKHFTLSHDQSGPDHQASLIPEELIRYVSTLRSIRQALGDGRKRVMPCELGNRKAFHRFLVSSRDIEQEERFVKDDFLFKKVADGIAPKHIYDIIGTTAATAISEGEVLHWKHVQFEDKTDS